MLSRIVVPIDASPASEAVLERLWPLLARPATEVVLVHSITPPLSVGLGGVSASDDLRVEAEEASSSLLRRLRLAGIRSSAVIRAANASDLILATAGSSRGGLIAMATHGRKGLARFAFGSVAESVLHSTLVPVLLLRMPAPIPETVEPLSFRRILVPLDGSPLALRVVPFVAELAAAFGSKVTVLHVLPPVPATADSLTYAEGVLQAARERFTESKTEIETRLRSGDPAEEILDACRETPFDLIGSTTHGRTGIARWVLGSVMERVLQGTEVPMLLVRASSA